MLSQVLRWRVTYTWPPPPLRARGGGRQMVLGYDRGEVAALQARLAHDLARPGLAPRDVRLLEVRPGLHH